MENKRQNLIKLIYKSLIFDHKTYKEVKINEEFTKYCLLIVIIAALANGIATAHYTNTIGLIKQLVFSIIGWIVRSGIIYIIGVKVIGYRSGIIQVVRTLGISYSPLIVNVFAIIPVIGLNIFVISVIWLFFTTVYAVKHTFGCNKLMSFFITLAGLIPYGIIMFLLIR